MYINEDSITVNRFMENIFDEEEITPEMNGYNVEKFILEELKNYFPELLDGLETDSEYGQTCFYYSKSTENLKKAILLEKIMKDIDYYEAGF